MSILTTLRPDTAISERSEPLSLCNHVSPRSYISLALCFPLEQSSAQLAVDHLRDSLQQVAKEQPLFTARLQLVGDARPGVTQLVYPTHYNIPFQVLSFPSSTLITYEELRKQGFPQRFFVGPQFDMPGHVGSDPLPISQVHAIIIPGGLLLTIYLHHSIGDGHSMRQFLKCFAAKTKGEAVDMIFTQSMRGSWPYQETAICFSSMLSACPEFVDLSDLRGPWQTRTSDVGPPLHSITRIGKIFVFSEERIADLRKLVSPYLKLHPAVSTYTYIAALSFAHIIKSRMQTEDPMAYGEDENQAVLWNTIGWRSRVSRALPEEYFGNAVLLNATRVQTDWIYRACDDLPALASLICWIKDSIDEVDESFIDKRLSLFSKIDDPRILGFDLDPRVPMNLIFNSWRYFGADLDWGIPGVTVGVPESVRKVQGSWNLGTAILLPQQPASGSQELFVSLPEGAMDLLCADQEWLRWVSRIID